MQTIQNRTPEAIAEDINVLVGLGWKRESTPPYCETDLFYSKNGKVAIITTTTLKEEFLDKPIFKKEMFDNNGDWKSTEFVNPLPF